MAFEEDFQAAAEAIRRCDALFIGAGAGMGVDSGLPDFRGPEGFWKAYPPFRGRLFSEMSTPHWFQTDPQVAWGFFGHRLKLYRDAVPHAGFEILRKWSNEKPGGAFVFTSNVDGQFQKSQFRDDQIVECHGSIHHLQCSRKCTDEIWSAAGLQVAVDPESFRAQSAHPHCDRCGQIARPNILMFNDSSWIPDRTEQQWAEWQRWFRRHQSAELVTIELGAGHAVPTVRMTCESNPGSLIRINPRDCDVPSNGISLPVGAMDALVRLDELIGS